MSHRNIPDVVSRLKTMFDKMDGQVPRNFPRPRIP